MGEGGLGRLSYVSEGMNQDLQGVYTLSETVNIIEKVVEPISSVYNTLDHLFWLLIYLSFDLGLTLADTELTALCYSQTIIHTDERTKKMLGKTSESMTFTKHSPSN